MNKMQVLHMHLLGVGHTATSSWHASFICASPLHLHCPLRQVADAFILLVCRVKASGARDSRKNSATAGGGGLQASGKIQAWTLRPRCASQALQRGAQALALRNHENR